MFAALKAKVQGLRTIVVSGVLVAVGAAQTYGAVDITPLVRVFVKDENQLGVVMVVIALVFGYLRWITQTPVGQGTPAAVAPVSDKHVDEGV